MKYHTVKCLRFLSLFLFILPLGGGCALNGLGKVPQYYDLPDYDLPAEWYSSQKEFSPDFPMDSFIETNRDLDIAIIGEGFFVCADRSTGELIYTRLGHFNIDHEGHFVIRIERPSKDPTIGYFYSYLLEPRVVIPPGTERIMIHDDGAVWISLGSEVPQQTIGQIKLATFAHPEGLLQIEENLYCETEASGPATINIPGLDGTGVLKYQWLEVPTPVKRDVATR